MESGSSKICLGNALVIGGCGFVGSHIVDTLLSTYDASVSVLSRHSTKDSNHHPNVQYLDADITSLSSILPIFERGMFDVIFHTVSPRALGATPEELQQVNVDGTNCVIEACIKSGAKALVYTSTNAVVMDDLKTPYIDKDESLPVITGSANKDPYGRSKAEAETLVLAANAKGSLFTCSLRPAPMIGERDGVVTPTLADMYFKGDPNTQIGDNSSLVDYGYVGDVARAHVSAATALLREHQTTVPDEDKVAGEAFFITGEPCQFWTLCRQFFEGFGDKGDRKIKVISKTMALVLAGIMEFMYWPFGKTPPLTRQIVYYICMNSYFKNDKAKKRLGYKVTVPLEEAIQRSAKWYMDHKYVADGDI